MCSQTNVAVDNILLGLQRKGFEEFARVGRCVLDSCCLRVLVVPVRALPGSKTPSVASFVALLRLACARCLIFL